METGHAEVVSLFSKSGAALIGQFSLARKSSSLPGVPERSTDAKATAPGAGSRHSGVPCMGNDYKVPCKLQAGSPDRGRLNTPIADDKGVYREMESEGSPPDQNILDKAKQTDWAQLTGAYKDNYKWQAFSSLSSPKAQNFLSEGNVLVMSASPHGTNHIFIVNGCNNSGNCTVNDPIPGYVTSVDQGLKGKIYGIRRERNP
jgi:hypothetical protein